MQSIITNRFLSPPINRLRHISWLALLLCTAAGANETIDLGEMNITATKRGTVAVQAAPIAISALDTARLEDGGVTQFDQWAGQVSGLNFEDWGPNDKDFIIRGINSPTGGTVGVYFDEAVITGRRLENGGGRQVDFKLHDIERIEVLKGPQGTLYGANSLSGAIRIIPAAADAEDLDAYLETEIGHTEEAAGINYNINGMVNVPLNFGGGGGAALRLVGWRHDNAGYIDNIRYQDDNVNDEKTYGGRALFTLQASNTLSLTALLMLQNTKLGNDSRITPAGVISPGTAKPRAIAALPKPVAMPTLQADGDYLSAQFVRTPWDEEARIYGLTAEWDLGHGRLTATTNLFTREIDYIYDSTPVLQFFNAPLVATTNQTQQRDTHSSEIRYASALDGAVNFVLGGLYQTEDVDFNLQVLAADANGEPVGTFSRLDKDDAFSGKGTTIFGRTLTAERQNLAAFGTLHYALGKTIDLNLGARYFHSNSTSVSANTHPFFGFQGRPIDFQDRKTSDSKLTFKANIGWQAGEALLLYASIAQGFRPGGTNAVILPADTNITLPQGYGPDELISYELGAKSGWLNNRLLFNAALYYTDWQDIQTDNKANSFDFIDNLGSASVIGAECDLRYRPAPRWDFALGGAVIKTRLEDDEPITAGDAPGVKGDAFPNVPRVTGFARATYTHELGRAMALRISLDISHRGASATEFNQGNRYYNRLGSYTLANLSAGLAHGPWQATFFVNNLLDSDKTVDIVHDQQEALQRIALRPRTLGLRLNYSY